MKFALLSHILPPSPSGQAVVLYRILYGIHEDEYYLIHSGNSPHGQQNENDLFHLRVRCYSLPTEILLPKPNIFGFGHIRNFINLFVKVYVRTKNIVAVLRREPLTTSLVACSGDFTNIPAGFLASRMLHLPFYAYIFDDYVFQWTGIHRWVARLIAPFVFKHSAGIIAPNEFVCEEYQRRYGVKTILVRNPCDEAEFKKEPHIQMQFSKNKIKVMYTGSIYHANLGCFHNFIQALNLLRDYPLELHIFTSQSPTVLAEQGVFGEGIFIHSHIPYNEILDQQYKADILFLPLAFESPIPEVIRTSAPGKLGEYLASGRPVLAHVPANSFVAYYFKKYYCGFVSDQNDSQKLAMEIKRLVTDSDNCNEIVKNAYERAKIDFQPELARNQFMELLKV